MDFIILDRFVIEEDMEMELIMMKTIKKLLKECGYLMFQMEM